MGNYSHPIKRNENLFEATGKAWDGSKYLDAKLTLSCDKDLLFAIVESPLIDTNTIAFIYGADVENGETLTFTSKIEYTDGDEKKESTKTTSTTFNISNGLKDYSLVWGDNDCFRRACLPPLNQKTGFLDWENETYENGRDYVLRDYKQHTGKDATYIVWGGTSGDYNAGYIDPSQSSVDVFFNPECFIDLQWFKNDVGNTNNMIVNTSVYDTNADSLNNIPCTTYYGTDNTTAIGYDLPYVIFNGETVLKDNFRFDVYLDGKTESNIGVTWNRESSSGSWSGELTTPTMWFYTNGSAIYVPSSESLPPYPDRFYMLDDNGVNVPNTTADAKYVLATKKFDDGTYNTNWISVDNSIWNGVSAVERFISQGVGKTGFICLLLRFDFYNTNERETTWSDLFLIKIPKKLPETAEDIEVVRVQNSSYKLAWNVNAYVHFEATPENDNPREPADPTDPNSPYDPYDPNNPTPSNDLEMGDGSNTSGLLTATYAMSAERLKNLGGKLWTQDYFNVLKIQNNPIENIISVKAFPFDIDGTEKSVVIGDIDMGVNGLLTNDIKRINIGEVTVNGYYNNFLDFAPFTTLSIFLPYIGFKELDASKLVNTKLKVEYIIDFITGACKAILYSNNYPLHEFDGTMGIDVPLTSSDRAQTDLKHLQNIVSGGAHLLNKDILGVVNTALSSAQMQYSSDTTSGGSPSCSSCSCRNIYLIYNRPYFNNNKSFNHVYGRASKKTATLSSLTGFTMTNRDIDLSGISCLSEERDMLRDLLSSGVYL